MANGYTAVPAVIPGPLQVQGVLTVADPGGIVIGGSGGKVRLFKRGIGGLGLSFNMGIDEFTRDSSSVPALALLTSPDFGQFGTKQFNIPGSSMIGALEYTLAQNGSAVTVTGTVAETTTHSKVVIANSLQQNGALLFQCQFAASTQGATATTFRIKFGGQVMATVTRAVLDTFMVVGWLFLSNSAGGVRFAMLTISGVQAMQNNVGQIAVDTTLDQTFAITIQPGATTDSWNDMGYRLSGMVPTSGPL